MPRGLRGLQALFSVLARWRSQPIRSAAARVNARTRCARRMTLLAVSGGAALALAGCTHGFEDVFSTDLWVEPGKYDFLKCPDLARLSVATSTREKELVSLMDRANQSGAGPVVNLMVYEADLKQVRAQLALLERTAREKGCQNLVPDAKATPTPPPTPKAGRPK